MDLTVFEDRLDLYGADLARWPDADQVRVAALVAASVDAREILAAMAEIEAVLRDRLSHEPGAAGVMAARAMRHRQETPTRRLARRAGLAAAAAIVLMLGISIGDIAFAEHADDPDRVMAVAFDTGGAADVD